MLKLSPRAQLAIGLALALLLAMTRGQHFATVNLPSASWAVFFLAGALLRPRWLFPALFIEASLLDFAAVQWAGVSDWCLSPAYWMLLPAYGSLWLGGRLYAGWQREHPSSLALLMATVKLWVSAPTSRCEMTQPLWACMTSMGSSMVTMWPALLVL